jgi:hypothetical protein
MLPFATKCATGKILSRLMRKKTANGTDISLDATPRAIDGAQPQNSVIVPTVLSIPDALLVSGNHQNVLH